MAGLVQGLGAAQMVFRRVDVQGEFVQLALADVIEKHFGGLHFGVFPAGLQNMIDVFLGFFGILLRGMQVGQLVGRLEMRFVEG